ncbi:cyanate transporter, partial [Pseudomonas sp. BAgro211]|nr:cyanate transporter [Pseudomonas sp. BAgro211]
GPLEFVCVWIVLLGLGQGALTAVALTKIMLRTRNTHTAVHLSGMIQGVGYGVFSVGTLIVAQNHNATGQFTLEGWAFLAIG